MRHSLARPVPDADRASPAPQDFKFLMLKNAHAPLTAAIRRQASGRLGHAPFKRQWKSAPSGMIATPLKAEDEADDAQPEDTAKSTPDPAAMERLHEVEAEPTA